MTRSYGVRGDVACWLAAWVLAIGAGFFRMHDYAANPGDPGAPPSRWPIDSRLRRDETRPTLLIFIHPRCPCSRASVAELAAILGRTHGQVAARACLFRPLVVGDSWCPPDLLADLEGIPNLQIAADPGGEEARGFGVATSGHVLLFDTEGILTFSGGITPGRGERADGGARATLLARLLDRRGRGQDGPIFGCALASCRPTGLRELPR